MGTAHPLVVDAVSRDGSWVVACQAREDTNGDGKVAVELGPRGELVGDAMVPYLITEPGPGRAIDELVAADPTSRWLVIREGERMLLIDTMEHTELDLHALGADSRADAIPYADHRTISFDGEGLRLLYVRNRDDKTEVVVRNLPGGEENVVDPGPGKLWRAKLDFTGNWVLVQMIAQDTSGNGRLGWPVPERARLAHRCVGPIPRHAAWQDRGDEPVTLVARSSGGKAKLVSGLITPLRRHLLVRLPGGELFAQPWKGKRRRFGKAKCPGHLVHADVNRELALFACETDEEARPRLELRGAGLRLELEREVTGQAVEIAPQSAPRLVPVYPGVSALLVDFEKRSTRELQERDRVLVTRGSKALVRRQDELRLVDVDEAEETVLATLEAPLPYVSVTPPVVVVSPFVIDVEAGRVLGTESSMPLAVTRQGHVLVALQQEPDADQLAVGPLLWRAPEPLSTE